MTGVILAQHNEIAYLEKCLASWIAARQEVPLSIVCLDVSFAENGEGNSTDGSLELLQQYRRENKIDHLEVLPPNLKEHEARNVALKWLLDKGCELILSIGSDEVFEVSEIKQILNYVNSQPLIAVFKIHYKNYVFDKRHYVSGFAPHRIWRANYNGYKLKSFAWDDDAMFEKNGEQVTDKQFPIKIVPKVQPKHYTWCDLERSRKKIYYQTRHFENGAGCSFKIENDEIKFNEEYYKKTGQPLPEVFEDNYAL